MLQPQAGPQHLFCNKWAGMSGEPLGDDDFPLLFYGGEICASLLGDK